MKSKIKNIAAATAAVLFILICSPPCPVKALFKIPCPGCGMTRAAKALMRFDISAAFRYNIIFIPLLAGICCIAVMYALGMGHTVKKIIRGKWFAALCAVLAAASQIYNIAGLLANR